MIRPVGTQLGEMNSQLQNQYRLWSSPSLRVDDVSLQTEIGGNGCEASRGYLYLLPATEIVDQRERLGGSAQWALRVAMVA